jgi:hypothetical protein
MEHLVFCCLPRAVVVRINADVGGFRAMRTLKQKEQ